MDAVAVDWGLKARALLLKSPFAGVDPAGEEERSKALLGWLEDSGVRPPDDAQRRLLDEAGSDAYDAMSLLRQVDGTAPPVVEAIVPVHPLSAQPSEPAFSRDSAPDLWRGFWRRFSGHQRLPRDVASADAYRRLFHAWSDAAFESGDSRLALVPTDATRPDCPVWSHRRLASAIAGARSVPGAQGEEGRPALLYLHVGPVQSFITAARRTHDLWMGSFLLSYLVLQAAKAIAGLVGPDSVVYPDLSTLPLARRVLFGEQPPADNPEEWRAGLLRASIANRVLAVVPAGAGDQIAACAMKAVDATWKEMARSVQPPINEATKRAQTGAPWTGFDAQIGGHLEMDAVVLPWPQTRSDTVALFADLPVKKDAIDEAWPAGQEDRRGFAYGPLFNLTHKVLAAHRSTFEAAPPTASSGASASERASGAASDFRPKCTQCGLREQMGPLVDEKEARRQHAKSSKFWNIVAVEARDAALQINVGEGLCAVCLTKRFAPQTYFGAGGAHGAKLGIQWSSGERVHPDRALLRFPSTASIASAPFRKLAMGKGAAREWAAAVGSLQGLLDFTPPGNLLPGLGPLGRSEDEVLAQEGAWLYESSYEPTVAWSDHRREPASDDDEAYRKLRERLPGALDAYWKMRRAVGSRPSPYFAVIQLDGDRMGEWLTGRHAETPRIREILAGSGVRIPEEVSGPRPLFPALHGELSRRLASLARRLHEIVNEKYLGRVVYSGGDDLLAFVPLANALPCLGSIRDAFRAEEHLGERMTISAGVAVAHWRDPLGAVLRAARAAEEDAKSSDRRPNDDEPKDRWGRNRFSVRLLKRSGEELRLTVPCWTLPFRESGSLAGDFDTPACILEMLEFLRRREETEDENKSLAAPSAAYKLRRELEMVGPVPDHRAPGYRCPQCHGRHPLRSDDETIARAFWHRVEVLLGMGDRAEREEDEMAAGLPAFLGVYWDELLKRFCLPRAASAFCDLLLFVRFLLREGGAE